MVKRMSDAGHHDGPDRPDETVRVLAVADEVDSALGPSSLQELRPDLILACGDLPFSYLEYLVTLANVPLLYVPGNHDPDLTHPEPPERVRVNGPIGLPGPVNSSFHVPRERPSGPAGCTNVDGRVVEERKLRVAGLGGCVRYHEGPNQYTQAGMRRRALSLEARTRLRHPGRGVDIVVTHAPPLGAGDAGDPAHQGFAAFHRLIDKLRPRLLVHGHVHPYGRHMPRHTIGDTSVVNVIPHKLLEVPRWPAA
jgi:hypothetical protein